MNFGHTALNADLRQSNRPEKARTALDQALAELAAAMGRKELPKIPLLGVRRSAGGSVPATEEPRHRSV